MSSINAQILMITSDFGRGVLSQLTTLEKSHWIMPTCLVVISSDGGAARSTIARESPRHHIIGNTVWNHCESMALCRIAAAVASPNVPRNNSLVNYIASRDESVQNSCETFYWVAGFLRQFDCPKFFVVLTRVAAVDCVCVSGRVWRIGFVGVAVSPEPRRRGVNRIRGKREGWKRSRLSLD